MKNKQTNKSIQTSGGGMLDIPPPEVFTFSWHFLLTWFVIAFFRIVSTVLNKVYNYNCLIIIISHDGALFANNLTAYT